MIDYPAVWAAKAGALEARFANAADDPDFAAFVASGGVALERFAAFEAIADPARRAAWRDWRAGLQARSGTGRTCGPSLAQTRPGLPVHQYLQWLCERQLAAAAARASGLELGFCRDLAVGAAPDGAEAWHAAAGRRRLDRAVRPIRSARWARFGACHRSIRTI